MPKTTRTQPGRLSSRFWRLLGASTEKNQSRSLAEVAASSEYDEKAADLSDEKLRVLYIEGLPRWDFRFLKNAMRRDHGLAGRTAKEPDIVLEAEWRRRPADQQLAALPRKLEQLAEYHTIILGDVSPELLDPAFLALLEKAVRERGVGLIVAAGPLWMPGAPLLSNARPRRCAAC